MPRTTATFSSSPEVGAGDVVEEEERLGAGGQDVVDAVVDEVDADGVEAAHGGGDVQLRADAVGAGDEHGLAVVAEPEEGREGPDAGEHLRPARGARRSP